MDGIAALREMQASTPVFSHACALVRFGRRVCAPAAMVESDARMQR
jgi:hypothetical protein